MGQGQEEGEDRGNGGREIIRSDSRGTGEKAEVAQDDAGEEDQEESKGRGQESFSGRGGTS